MSGGWDPDTYDDDHGFVTDYGRDLLDLLDPDSDERVLDVGCGTGHLTAVLAERCAEAVGIDASAAMIDQARESHPGVDFVHADVRRFTPSDVGGRFDAALSNAALHWVPERDQRAALSRVADALAPGGRFVAELGGTGNVGTVETATRDSLAARGHDVDHPWYFPSIGEYATLLEDTGFEVREARLFDRPTPLEGGEEGMNNWLRQFATAMLEPVPERDHESVLDDVCERLRRHLYDEESETWTVDYRRLRFRAVRGRGET